MLLSSNDDAAFQLTERKCRSKPNQAVYGMAFQLDCFRWIYGSLPEMDDALWTGIRSGSDCFRIEEMLGR